MRVLLFRDTSTALRFIRRHGDKVVQIIIVVDEDGGGSSGSWKGAIKRNYNAIVLSGLIVLQES